MKCRRWHFTQILYMPVIAIFFSTCLFGESSFSDEQRIIDHLLRSNDENNSYDWRVRPRGFVESRESALRRRQFALENDPNSTLHIDNVNQLYKIDEESEKDEPIIVTTNMYLSMFRSISEVDDVNMEYTAHFTFRQEWTDERLLFYSNSLNHIILGPDQRIFLPDTFFQNEKNGKKHNIDKPNVMIRVYNGTARVLYSCRLTLTLSCPMYLQAYPLDTQTCFIDYASYAYTTKDIVYSWKSNKPIQIKPGLKMSLPSFVLSGVFIGNCTSETNTGSYSCLRTIIRLKREFSYYLIQLYIPSFMLVVVSNVSFWLDKDSVPARVTLGTTVLLTVTTMASGINANLPPVSYTKSVDIWIGVCTGFIFGALLEFSLVNWAARKEAFTTFGRMTRIRNFVNQNLLLVRRRRLPVTATLANQANFSGLVPILSLGEQRSDVHASTAYVPLHPNIASRIEHDISIPLYCTFEHELWYQQVAKCLQNIGCIAFRWIFHCDSPIVNWWTDIWNNKCREKSKRIDLLARILFPFFFIIFNVIYWMRYLRPYLNIKSEMEEDL